MKNKLLFRLVLIFLMSTVNFINAQTTLPDSLPYTCGHEKAMQISAASDPTYTLRVQNIETEIQKIIGENNVLVAPYTIPVVFHVFHNGDAYGTGSNISEERIQAQMSALNTAFANSYANYNFQSTGVHAVNTQIRFCLATVPQPLTTNFSVNPVTGNTECGIMRYNVPTAELSHNMDAIGQQALLNITHPTPQHFPFANCLNIWLVDNVCNGADCFGTIGYATFPGAVGFDGIVMRANVIGDNTITTNQFTGMHTALQQGKILAHEVGHYLGLFHTFHQQAGDPVCAGINDANCAAQGDLICDTPPTSMSYDNGCVTFSSCVDNLAIYGGVNQNDMIENYMSYSLDNCMNTFTSGQSARMQAVLDIAGARQNLVSNANHLAMGISNVMPCLCSAFDADFSYTILSTGCHSVEFLVPTSNSLEQVNYLWDFGDGTFSNLQIPIHNYANSGIYTVTLTIDNGIINAVETVVINLTGGTVTLLNPDPQTVCNGSTQTLLLEFQGGIPPYNVTVSNGIQNLNFVFNRKLEAINVNINGAVGTTQVWSITNYIEGTCGGTISAPSSISYTISDCSCNFFVNGDFETYSGGVPSILPSTTTLNYSTNMGFGQYWVGHYTSTMQWSTWHSPTAVAGTNMYIDYFPAHQMAAPIPHSLVLCQTFNNILPATDYRFDISTKGDANGNQYKPNIHQTDITFQLKLDNNFVGNEITFPKIRPDDIWMRQGTVWNSGTTVGTATLCVCQTSITGTGGSDDYIIDDITLRTMVQPVQTNLTATNVNVCIGNSTQLTANIVGGNAPYTVSWEPGSLSGTTVNVSPIVTTTYTATVKDNFGCVSVATIVINASSCGQYCSDPITQVIPDGATSATNPITATTVDILGTYTISSSITYSNIRFRMAPNSQIVVPAGVTLSLSGCNLFSCTDMWNGILIQGNTAQLISNNTWFEDAISAVNSIGGGKYDISKSRFNKNYTGIYIDTYTPANTSIVQSSIFECQTSLTSPGATLKAPYLNTKSHYGIDVLNNAGGLTFGLAGGSGLQNEFRYIDLGIHSSNSKITVYNNYFHHLTRNCVQTPMDDPCQPEGWGIWAETFGELYVGNMATTNNFNNSYSNTFIECDGGIMAQVHVRKIEICKNKFEKIGVLPVAEPNRKAIFINTNSNSEVQYCIIQNNKFKDNYRSILYQGNKYLLGRINSNKFNNSGEYGIKCMQNINGLATHVLDIKFNSMNDSTSLNSIYGIWVVNTVTTNSARLTIESNSIKKIQKAIWVTNMQNKAQVIRHNVNYSSIFAAAGITFSSGTATSSSPNCGITVENCKGIHVKENDVAKQGSPPNSSFSNSSYGITSSLSASSVISNNTIHRLGRGLVSLGTPNASVVTCNYLDKNFYGLVLDNTNIVNQGSATLAQDNQWSSASVASAKTVYGTNSSIPVFYARNTTTQFMPTGGSMIPVTPSPINFQLTSPNPTYNCLFGCAAPPCINPNLARIVRREPPFNLLPAEEQLIVDFSTLQMIKENDSLTQFGQPEANTLIAFKDSLLNTNTGLLQTFVEKMDSGDSLLAKQALMAVVPSYSPEENAKIVDEVYYRTWAKDLFELSREDSARLLQVAQQWPVKGGTAVFDARVMIGYWQNDHFVDNNNARLANTTFEGDERIADNYGVLYPNPAQNIINYDITLEEGEVGLLLIYDVTGKLINTQKIIEGESKSIIDCEEWNNGIYFYRLLINGEPKASNSFMISK